MPRWRAVGLGVAVAVGLVLWIAGPFGVLAAVMQADLSDELVVQEQPTVVVGESRGGATEMVGVALAWEAPVELFAPGWEGVVQRVEVAPGAEVGNGDPVVTVNGLKRLLAASGEPFWRPLGLNATGNDARRLNEWLTSLGLPHGSGATVTSATVRGVREVAGRVGFNVAAADAAAVPIEFDPTWVIFAPRERFTIGSVDLRVGAPAPAPGTAFLKAKPALSGAVAVDAETARRASEGTEAPVVEEGEDGEPAGGAPQEPTPGALPEGTPVPASRAVFIDEQAEPLALAEDRMTFTPEAVAALSKVVEPGERARRLESRPIPAEGELQVPATAVAVGEDGTFCVIDTTRRAHPVEVTDTGGGSISFLSANGELSSGTRVLDRPPATVACRR